MSLAACARCLALRSPQPPLGRRRITSRPATAALRRLWKYFAWGEAESPFAPSTVAKCFRRDGLSPAEWTLIYHNPSKLAACTVVAGNAALAAVCLYVPYALYAGRLESDFNWFYTTVSEPRLESKTLRRQMPYQLVEITDSLYAPTEANARRDRALFAVSLASFVGSMLLFHVAMRRAVCRVYARAAEPSKLCLVRVRGPLGGTRRAVVGRVDVQGRMGAKTWRDGLLALGVGRVHAACFERPKHAAWARGALTEERTFGRAARGGAADLAPAHRPPFL